MNPSSIPEQPARQLGVTVVAGFLGAGKTTLVNHLLSHAGGRRLGVMVNDFGALNIDEALIDERRDDLITLSNGCVCCSLQGELSAAIDGLLTQRAGSLDHLLIECSGVSDPQRVVNVLGYPRIRARARLEGVITLVDAALDRETLSPALRHLVASQIDNADLVLINKVDLVEEASVAALEAALLLPDSRHLRTTQAVLPPEAVFLPSLRAKASPLSPHTGAPTTLEALGLRSLSWECEGAVATGPLRELLDDMPRDILRFKGVVRLDDGRRLVLQRAAGRLTSQELDAPGQGGSRLVFIGEQTPEAWEWLSRRLEGLQA